MAARKLLLFNCCKINPNKKRTQSGITEPESSKPRSDVKKPEETQQGRQ